MPAPVIPEKMRHTEKVEVGDNEGEYWIYGERVTREDYVSRMPTVRDGGGFLEYVKNGDYHNPYGPAKICTIDGCLSCASNNKKERYYIWGNELTKEEFDARTPEMLVFIDERKEIDEVRWVLKGQLHREDGPALVTRARGKVVKEYWLEGKRHREGLPAVFFEDGGAIWCQDGMVHRENAPAIVVTSQVLDWWSGSSAQGNGLPRFRGALGLSLGDIIWMKDGKLHREDGPAIFRANGKHEWWVDGRRVEVVIENVELKGSEEGPLEDGSYYIFGEPVTAKEYWKRMPRRHLSNDLERWSLNGSLHRLYGPAVVSAYRPDQYWVYGEQVTRDQFLAMTSRPRKRDYGVECIIWENARNKSHRLDGPALYVSDFDLRIFRQHGELHREDGPALEYRGMGAGFTTAEGRRWRPGDEVWALHGKYHRKDGPACLIHTDEGRVEEWWEEGNRHRIDGPAVRYEDGREEYWVAGKNLPKEEWERTPTRHEDAGLIRWVLPNGDLHREDGPAVVYKDGTGEEWYWCGKRHRVDGPAAILTHRQEYWIRGEVLTYEEFLRATRAPSVLRVSLEDTLLKAKWDLMSGTARAILGVPQGPMWDVFLKMVMAMLIHRQAETYGMRQFAEDALRVTFTEAGFDLIETLFQAGALEEAAVLAHSLEADGACGGDGNEG